MYLSFVSNSATIMSQISAIKLIDSMSKEEKRKFKLSTNKQAGKQNKLSIPGLQGIKATEHYYSLPKQRPGISRL